MLNVIHSSSSQVPELEKDREKQKGAAEGVCLLEISMRKKIGINVNFQSCPFPLLNFISVYHSLSDEDKTEFRFWCVK